MQLNDLEKIDVKEMFRTYDKWPEIAKDSFENEYQKLDVKEIDHLVFAGMGGSGSIGDTIKAILSKEDFHVSIVEKYQMQKVIIINTNKKYIF